MQGFLCFLLHQLGRQMMLRASASRLSAPLLRTRNVRCVRRIVLTRTMASLQKTSYGQDERIPAWIGGPAERPAVIVLQVHEHSYNSQEYIAMHHVPSCSPFQGKTVELASEGSIKLGDALWRSEDLPGVKELCGAFGQLQNRHELLLFQGICCRQGATTAIARVELRVPITPAGHFTNYINHIIDVACAGVVGRDT